MNPRIPERACRPTNLLFAHGNRCRSAPVWKAREDNLLKRFLVTILGSYLLCTLAAVPEARATVIDFEAQTVNLGGNLTGIPNSPLTIGIATFTDGELLSAEVGLSADQTGVYASEGLFGSGETNPLAISFAIPVNAFSIFVANADDTQTYTVSNNLGDSVTKSLTASGNSSGAIFSLAGAGLTTVDISSANTGSWNFAIDNVSFTPGSPTPEPGTLWGLAGGLAALTLAGVRTNKISKDEDIQE